ncbi:MAG: V-type ATP synthase subunit K [Candidatus Brocadiales bacterium]
MEEFLKVHFLETGLGWAGTGAMMAVMFGGMGSARGIRTAVAQAAGVLSEKPELFGRLLVLMAMPGTQGFYGFICAVTIAMRIGLIEGTINVSPIVGMGLFFTGLFMGVVLWRSATWQGEASAAAINLTAKRPEEAGRAILMPALVETYAVVALLAAILMIMWLTKIGGLTFVTPETIPH